MTMERIYLSKPERYPKPPDVAARAQAPWGLPLTYLMLSQVERFMAPGGADAVFSNGSKGRLELVRTEPDSTYLRVTVSAPEPAVTPAQHAALAFRSGRLVELDWVDEGVFGTEIRSEALTNPGDPALLLVRGSDRSRPRPTEVLHGRSAPYDARDWLTADPGRARLRSQARKPGDGDVVPLPL